MRTKSVILSFIAIVISFSATAQDYHVRFGFLGNSITIGAGLSNAKEECYPAQIANLLAEKYGDTCIVGNYAVSGRTLLKKGDFPLWNEDLFNTGWQEAPDICFICLGTNDTKPQNWDKYGNEFLPDYLAMMDTFKLRNPKVKFIVCYPPPAYDVVWDISNDILVSGVLPAVDSVLAKRDAILVDFYNPLLDSVYLFPDKIHPSALGSKVMAKIAFNKIVESDIVHQVKNTGTFVTYIESDATLLRKGDSLTISWITRNANEAYLNGIAVDVIGSKKVAPTFTTKYTLLAKGAENSDSLTMEQQVYIPELVALGLDPSRVTIAQGKSIDLLATFYDQYRNEITNTPFNVVWSIVEGDGALSNKTNTSATFTTGAIGKTKVKAAVGEIGFTSSITIEAGNAVGDVEETTKKGYPNPCSSFFYVPVKTNRAGSVELTVYDMIGKCWLKQQVDINTAGEISVVLNVESLKAGLYIYTFEGVGQKFSGKINKR